MRIEIRVGRSSFRRWHRHLADRLARTVAGAEVRIRVTAGELPLGPALDLLLQFERMVVCRSRETLADPVIEVPADRRVPDGFTPDVLVDCSGADQPADSAALVLRPLYDGAPLERAMVAAILARSLPQIEVEDVGAGCIVAWGRPSGESARGLTGGIDAVVTRVMVLVESAIKSRLGVAPRSSPRPIGRAHLPIMGFALRNVAADCARALYHLCLYSPHWRIGWRLHDGPGVMERADLGGPGWRVLADPGRRFFADPFPVTWAGRTFLFFEDLDHRVGKGVISAMEFGPDGPVGGARPVLEEPWHMSYPFLIEHGGALFMVPESSLSGSVPIYRCIDFPDRWERVGTLLDGVEAADCTIFEHDDLFWMMSVIREGAGGYSDILSIHYARDLMGPWSEHAQRPALLDVAAARPAGAVIKREGRLWRPIQDCSLGYGRVLGLAEIDRLDTQHFSQTVRHRIEPGPLWPGKGLHTLNRFGRLECIDGITYNPKMSAPRGFVDRHMMPRSDTAGRELQPISGRSDLIARSS